MTTSARLCFVAAGCAAFLSACVSFGGYGPDVLVVRDLSKVAGCQFVGTVRPPPVQMGLRRVEAFDAYADELKRRTARLGGTHLYLLNEAAGWGAAEAVGTAYRCIA